MSKTIKNRLDALKAIIQPKSIMVAVELPDGRTATKNACDWWEHRREWPLADYDRQTPEAGNIVFLVLAALADEAIQKATSQDEIENLEKERHDMLVYYFGNEAIP